MPNRRRSTGESPVARRPVFVDSGAWIALFSARDTNHAEADRLFRTAVSGKVPLFTTNLVAAELHRLLLFRVGIAGAGRALDVLDASAALRLRFVTEADHRQARVWLRSLADQKITYTDAVSFAVMQASGCRAFFGFDRDFEIAGFERWRG